jgi:chromosome partitioning protein
MRTIAVVNAKGGCGKTTIATSLAAALAWEGHSVALGDMDPQQSANDWLSLRGPDYPVVAAVNAQGGPLRAPPETDILILDTPAGIHGTELGHVLRRAETVLVPVLPSPVDMRAAWRFLSHMLELKPVQARETVVGLIANRVRPHTIIYRELTGFLDDFRVPVVGQLRDSMNYVRAFERGLSVSDLPPYQAWQDWEEWEAVLTWIRSRRSRGKG